MVKRKSKATVMVADGIGGMTKVEDRRFELDWPIRFDVAKEQADTWFLYFDAECSRRGWHSSEMGQHEPQENSGSIAINSGMDAPQLAVIWERKRNGAIRVRAGSPGTAHAEIQALFDQVNERCRSGAKECFLRRGQLHYDGLPWRGELWLGDTFRLGPPSQEYEGALRGPRVVLVDAMIDAVGPMDSVHVVTQQFEELSAFLSVVTGHAFQIPRQSEQSWTYTIVDAATVCDVRWLGYVESRTSNQMPVRGALRMVPSHAVVRPDFSLSVNSFIDTSEISLPGDIGDLWAMYRALTTDRRRQFLQATAKWQEALLMRSLRRPTLSFALMVVACEALKPSDSKFKHHNINHIVMALLGSAIAARLQQDWFRAQYVRSVHVHLGEFLGSEFRTAQMVPRFYDPTFDAARRELAAITRAALIEWLRRGGTFSMPVLKGKKTRPIQPRMGFVRPSKARKPRSKLDR